MRRAAEPAIEPVRLRFAHAFDDVRLQQRVADQQRAGDPRFDRLLVLAADHEPVHYRVDVPDVACFRKRPVAPPGHSLGGVRGVELDPVRDVHRPAVDDQVPAPLLPHFGEDEVQLLAVDLEHRCPQLDLRAFRQRQDRLENLARRPARRRLAGARTMRLGDGREEQIQVARDVGHRPDRRARVAGERLLLDRDHRRQAEHEVDVGLRHLRDESLGVTRERLHVTPLTLGVDRVERQARLAGAREPGDDDQAVARDFQRDVLEVVHARAVHTDGGPGLRPGLRRHSALHSCRRMPAPALQRCSSS